ncbi:hypothetical protein [Knoellia subterranea]|uniref:Peptidase S1 domain-containing protein n=1 Tax=Knoellia subterranea KCTC 19937 TaxID=1385521 RepID=A0A0A0JT96_9MICO|nr:hypothetical protein [Knoellia subterranea]KGN38871.1 hypothetical protein N803_08000 [Knoellia subterranea KCTC 19937]
MTRKLALLLIAGVLAGPMALATSTHNASTGDPVVAARVLEVERELASHPEWPQRPITAKGAFVEIPYGPADPKEYGHWMRAVGERYEGAVVGKYSPGADGPSKDELDAVSRAVGDALAVLPDDVGPGYTVMTDLTIGKSTLTYGQTEDVAFLAIVEKVKAKYPDHLVVQTSNIKSGPQSLVTKGGYGIASTNQAKDPYLPCTLGFNMVKNGVKHFVTAAHCFQSTPYSGIADLRYSFVWSGGYSTPSLSDTEYLGQQSGSLIEPPSGDLAAAVYSTTNSIAMYGVIYPGGPQIDVIGTAWGNTDDWVCTFGARSLTKLCNYIQSGFGICKYSGVPEMSGMLMVALPTESGDSGAPLWKSGGNNSTAIGVGILSGVSDNGYRCFTDIQRGVLRWGLQAY